MVSFERIFVRSNNDYSSSNLFKPSRMIEKVSFFTCTLNIHTYKDDRTNISGFFFFSSSFAFFTLNKWFTPTMDIWRIEYMCIYNRKEKLDIVMWKKRLRLLLNMVRPFTTISNCKGGLSTRNTMRWIIASY